jgi:hypothetical protein
MSRTCPPRTSKTFPIAGLIVLVILYHGDRARPAAQEPGPKVEEKAAGLTPAEATRPTSPT